MAPKYFKKASIRHCAGRCHIGASPGIASRIAGTIRVGSRAIMNTGAGHMLVRGTFHVEDVLNTPGIVPEVALDMASCIYGIKTGPNSDFHQLLPCVPRSDF